MSQTGPLSAAWFRQHAIHKKRSVTCSARPLTGSAKHISSAHYLRSLIDYDDHNSTSFSSSPRTHSAASTSLSSSRCEPFDRCPIQVNTLPPNKSGLLTRLMTHQAEVDLALALEEASALEAPSALQEFARRVKCKLIVGNIEGFKRFQYQ
jgi:hypothetical protein